MRKLIAIPLLVLYVTAISGMMIQLHFCGNKLLSWKVNDASTSSCCSSSETDGVKPAKAGNDCCKDKTITFKIKQDQNRTGQLQMQLGVLQSAPIAAYWWVQQDFELSQTDVHNAYQANAPPGLWQNIPLYKLHARFTYYG